MRTFLVWTLRVTISPWNSLPTFLKEPMLAMSLLLAVSSPRPPRPRWQSGSRRRSTTHPFAGRSAAEDGGGRLPCLARNGQRPGEESRAVGRCVSGDRGAAVLRPDQAMERPCGPHTEQHPQEKTWRTSNVLHKRRGFQAKKRKPWHQKGRSYDPIICADGDVADENCHSRPGGADQPERSNEGRDYLSVK